VQDSDEFRIEYTITRRRAGQDEDDFTEIGFGSSGAWSTIDQCAHRVTSAVQNKEWETSESMPDPDDAEREAEDEPAYPTFSTYGDKHAVLDRVPGDRP
jgi:hypothetical protein